VQILAGEMGSRFLIAEGNRTDGVEDEAVSMMLRVTVSGRIQRANVTARVACSVMRLSVTGFLPAPRNGVATSRVEAVCARRRVPNLRPVRA